MPGAYSWLLLMFISSCECAITTVLFCTGWHSLRQEDLLFTNQHSALSEKGGKLFSCCWVTQRLVKPIWRKEKEDRKSTCVAQDAFSWQEACVCVLPAKHPCFCDFLVNP